MWFNARHLLTTVIVLALSILIPMTAFAAATATSVALNPSSSCTYGGLDIGLVSVNAVREGGIVTDETGAVLLTFDQGTGLPNFSGVYSNYSFPGWNVPAGTIIGLYAYIGETPYSAANTSEWFIAYVCDTQEVVYSCFGPYGTCPQSVTAISTASADACPNPLPSGFAVRSVPAGALAFYQPNSDTYAGFNLPPGTWYTGAPEDGYVEVWIACQATNVFIPEDNVSG